MIDVSKYGWARQNIPSVTVTEPITHTFGSPVVLYQFTGEGNVTITDAEGAEVYNGTLPYIPTEPVVCESLTFTPPVASTETAEDGAVTTTYTPVTVGFLGCVGKLAQIPSVYRRTSSGMTSVAGSVDDSVYTVSLGITGFKFNGSAVSTLYVSTNLFFGFGSNAEHLQIFRRDGRSTAIYRQTVTDGDLSFCKIRFEGYTVYNNQVVKNRVIYELFLMDSGDMFLDVIQAPTSAGTYGSSNLIVGSDTTALDIPANGTTGTLLSFYRADEDGKQWTVTYAEYELPSADEPLVLLRSAEKWYSVVDGTLTEQPVESLTALAFLRYGGTELPTQETMPENPKLCAWSPFRAVPLHWKATATPVPQTMLATVDISHESIRGIRSMAADFGGDITVRASADGGATYSEPVALSDWLNADCDELYESLGDDKLLLLKFILSGTDATLVRFRITYQN